MKKNYIFISYSHKDANDVLPIVGELAQNYRVKYDNSIGASSEYNDVIAEMISGSHIMAAFVSENYIDSSYCMDELLYARTKEIPVLLIYLENTKLPAGVEMRVGRFQSVDYKDAFYMNKVREIEEVQQCALGRNESATAFVNSASTSKRKKTKKKLSSTASALIIMVVTVLVTLLLGYGIIKIAGIDPSKLFDKTVAENQDGYQDESEDVPASEDSEEKTGDIQLADKEEQNDTQAGNSETEESKSQETESKPAETETQEEESKPVESVTREEETKEGNTSWSPGTQYEEKPTVSEEENIPDRTFLQIDSTTAREDGVIVWVERYDEEGDYFYILKATDGLEKELDEIEGKNGVKCAFDPYKQKLYLLECGNKLKVYEVDTKLDYTLVATLDISMTSQGNEFPCSFFFDGVMVFSGPQRLIDTNTWEDLGRTPSIMCILNDKMYTYRCDSFVQAGFTEIDMNHKSGNSYKMYYDAELEPVSGSQYDGQVYCDGSYAYFLGIKGKKDYLVRFDGEKYETVVCMNDYKKYSQTSYGQLCVTDTLIRYYDKKAKVFKEFKR